jgi:outer membrane protein assembly factor BamD (BamD/ComL family)
VSAQLARELLDSTEKMRQFISRTPLALRSVFFREEIAMSAVGISSTSFFDYSRQNIQTKVQQAQQEFQQLGQDLQSGNISAAQNDMTALQRLQPQGSTSSTQSNPIAQEFTQLSQDLQAGNISNAQQHYAKIQQDFASPPQPHPLKPTRIIITEGAGARVAR